MHIKNLYSEAMTKPILIDLKKDNEKYFQIDNEKNKEIEQIFNQLKLKIIFPSKPNILRDGKFYTISNGCFTIYKEKLFKKLYEINININIDIISAIQLDNKDLVILAENQLIIYRLKNEKYFLLQRIEENSMGYERQYYQTGSACMVNTKYYHADFIKDISENRFICGSNYGFKIYSLNEKNEYSISLLEAYPSVGWSHVDDGEKIIYELDKDTFIFCRIIIEVYLDYYNTKSIIYKINLREITNKEKEKKKKVIDSLKYTCNNVIIFNSGNNNFRGYNFFRGYTILKKNYFIIGIENNIFIFDISSNQLLRRYEFIYEGENSFFNNSNIIKWNNDKNNEFLFICKGILFLFELTNDNELKIISQSCFKNIISLKRINETNNIFYDDGIDENYENHNMMMNDSNYIEYYRNKNKMTNMMGMNPMLINNMMGMNNMLMSNNNNNKACKVSIFY